MNIFIYEMKQNKKSIIIWSISFIAMIAVFMQAAPLFVKESGSIKGMLNSLGDIYIKGLNIDIDTFFSEVGFYVYIFTYIGLIAAIQAMNLGLNVISKEVRMKTADFLMTKPRSRTKIFLSKLLSSTTSILIVQSCFYISAYVSMLIVSKGDFNFKIFMLISFTFFFIQMLYLALGMFLAIIIPKVKSVISVTMGVVFGTFMLGMISSIAESDFLRYLSPLRYFDLNYVMNNGCYEMKFLILSVILTVILFISSYTIYLRKDVNAV